MPEFMPGDIASFRQIWEDVLLQNNRFPFSTPDWAEQWTRFFGSDSQLLIGAVKYRDSIIGIAPLRIDKDAVCFIGSDDVCDFLDFVVQPDKLDIFFQCLFEYLRNTDYHELILSPLLPDSTVMGYLLAHSDRFNIKINATIIDTIVDMELPASSDIYLSSLNTKQKHELLRKQRRLNEEGDFQFKIYLKADEAMTDIFFHLFRESREDKYVFLNDTMQAFFRAIIGISESNDTLRFGLLELNDIPVAVTLCFDFQDEIYLYNSGYDPGYRWLSVGLLSKYFCIKDSIKNGKKKFNFLKGNEKYKFNLGGKASPVYRCIINY